MAHDVFISYSSHDKRIADAACAAIEQGAARCWIAPRDVLPSQSWAESIVDAISESRVFVVIFSSSSNASGQVLREVERAVSKTIPILPLRIENVQPSRSLEYFLATPHWLDAFTPPLEHHLQKMVATINVLLVRRDEGVLIPPVAEAVEPAQLEKVAPDEWSAPRGRFGRIMRRMLDDR